ncbi:uncharacterized protein LOC142572815 [Dermacentor variabilis]|uniref:uncharacterized protein LOC142572815 n=1 Tax=Dermacentor variabilis TaxID=34621 RepID=UPI003F5AE91D
MYNMRRNFCCCCSCKGGGSAESVCGDVGGFGQSFNCVKKDFTAMQRIRQDYHGFFYKFFRKAPQLLDKLLSFVAEDLTQQHHIRETPGAWRTTCCGIELLGIPARHKRRCLDLLCED